jgi:GT2 family glycosyltransferase
VTTASFDSIDDVIDDVNDEPFMDVPRRTHRVTAVLVTHDGAVWLPAALSQIAAQTHHVDALVAVDTGSSDDSVEILAHALGSDQIPVLQLSYSQAVNSAVAGIAAADDHLVDWIWLLHDDAAPDANCLAALLLAADMHPSAAILGPKILGWHDRRLLLEAGVSVTGSGRRYTGLERREHDQGQHDGTRDVLSVSSAGMLIRRDVWDALEGFDPRLPLFRNDLDLCMRAQRRGERVLIVTDAVMHHREASAHGRREGSTHPHRADRAAAAQVLLAQSSSWMRPLIAARLFIGGVLRSIAYVVGKDLSAAQDEFGATWFVLRHPGRIRQSAALVRATTTESMSQLRHLRPRFIAQVRQALEAFTGVLTTSSATSSNVSALDSGPIDDDAAYLQESTGWVRRFLWRPSVVLVFGLALASIIATRNLWWGAGVLQGGALLPAPSGAWDVWTTYAQAWHNVGPGSDIPAPPYLLVIFALAALFLGKVPFAVSVIALLSIPLAGWAAYVATRGFLQSTSVRVWAAVTYALLPALTGALASGRIGTSIAAIALPFAARSMVRIARPSGTVRRAAGTALLIALVVAGVPGLWVLFVIIGAVVMVMLVVQKSPEVITTLQKIAVALVGAFAVLMPWSWHVLMNPTLLLLQVGAQSPRLADPDLGPIDVLLLHPGGPGMTPILVTVGLVVAALTAFLRKDRLRSIVLVWSVGALALVFGVIQTVVLVTPPGSSEAIRPWPGPATLIIGAAFIVATALAIDGLRDYLANSTFTLLQPLAIVLIIAALSAPILSAIWWMPVAEGVMRKGPQSVVPAFVAAEAESPQAPRTLVLRQDRAGRVTYSLVNGDGPVLGQADVNPPAEVWDELNLAVAALAAGLGGPEVEILAGYGVRFVLLAAGTSSDLIPAIDAEPGLRRLATAQGEILWRVAGVTSRARVVSDDGSLPLGVVDPLSVTTDPYLDQPLPDGAGARTLVVGATPTSGWIAVRSDTGEQLESQSSREPYQWSAAFEAPEGPIPITVRFDDGTRTTWLFIQAVVFLGLIILALPARQRRVYDDDAEPAENIT